MTNPSRRNKEAAIQYSNSTQATVQNNYHIFLGEDKQYYSVPYKYAKKKVTVIYTTTTVEIYLKSQRIAIHNRLHSEDKYKFVTTDDHRPPKHKIHEQISNYTMKEILQNKLNR